MTFVEIVVLAGGIGGARFLSGLKDVTPASRITAVVNTGDDVTLHGMRICPDLDTVMYTLGGGIDPERGWGLAGESWRVQGGAAGHRAPPPLVGPRDRAPGHPPLPAPKLGPRHPPSPVT